MYLEKIEIIKYKSINNQTFWFENNKLIPIVGENNVGKTNLLECINLLNEVWNNRNSFYKSYKMNNELDHLSKNVISFDKINISHLDYEVRFYFKVSSLTFKEFELVVEVKNNQLNLVNVKKLFKNVLNLAKTTDQKINEIFEEANLYGKSNLFSYLKETLDRVKININSVNEHNYYGNLIQEKQIVSNLLEKIDEVKSNIYNYVYLDDDNLKKFRSYFDDFTHFLNQISLGYEKILDLPTFYYFPSFFENRQVSNLVATFDQNKVLQKWINFDLIDERTNLNNIEKTVKKINWNQDIKEINSFLFNEIKLNTKDIDNHIWRLYLHINKNTNSYDLRIGIGTPEDRHLEFSNQSLGTLKNFYYKLIINKVNNLKNDNFTYVIFDEPDAFLHIDRQSKILDNFFEVTKNNEKVVIIYSTHSTFMIDFRCLKALNTIKKNEKGSFIERARNIKDKNDPKLNGTLPAIIRSMGASISGYAFKDNILIVEGYSDFLYIRYFSKVLKIDLSFDIIYSNGASKVAYFNDIVKLLNKKVFCLFDNDEASEKATTKNYERLNLINFYKNENKKDIESLFDSSNFSDKNNQREKIDKNFNNTKVKWSENTKMNFKNLLEYINNEFEKDWIF